MRKHAITSVVVLSLLFATAAPLAELAVAAHDPSLSLTGCLLLSRKEGVFALHMEYNRIAVMGHADLANYLRHRVTLTGTFEERGDELRFIVDHITEVAPTCEVQVSVSRVIQPRAAYDAKPVGMTDERPQSSDRRTLR